jgi:hypothetical protein
LFVAGQLAAAQKLAATAEQGAKEASNRGLILQAQVRVTAAASAAAANRTHATRLSDLAKAAESAGLRALAVECAVIRAHALVQIGDQRAADEANRVIAAAESLGLRVAQAQAHHLRGAALRGTNDLEARREFAAAVRLLEQIRSDSGNGKVLDRLDLAPIYAESLKLSR